MNDLNSVLVEGNLTRDPQMSYTSKGTPLCNISIAVNRSYKTDNELKSEVSYIDIETWGKQAENCSQYLQKGRGIRIVGRLKQDRWESNGTTRSKIIIVAEHIEFKPDRKNAPQETAHAS